MRPRVAPGLLRRVRSRGARRPALVLLPIAGVLSAASAPVPPTRPAMAVTDAVGTASPDGPRVISAPRGPASWTGGGSDGVPAAVLAHTLDSLMAVELRAHRVPGLAIAVVKDGRIHLLKGYGYADLERRTPVDPERTLFRLASVSKTLTATAVMQLVERGLVDLDADIRRYIPSFSLPRNDHPEPVTLRHLLTHTAGFDEVDLGRATRDPSKFEPLAAYLARRLRRDRIRPPGRVVQYNDQAYALNGLVVEAVSGMPFAAYMRAHVLEPLGMERSTFEQLLPLELAGDLARGYHDAGGRLRPVGYDHIHEVPSAGLSATVADMARFAIAQLEGGRYGETRLLGSAALSQMQARQFAHHAQVDGGGFGLWEYCVRGTRALEHSGTWNGYMSMLLLLPAEGAGLFVAYNRVEPAIRDHLMDWFLEAVVPVPEPAKTAGLRAPVPEASTPPGEQISAGPTGRREWAARLAGSYRFTRYSRHTMSGLGKILSGEAPEVRVTADRDGTVTVFGRRWLPVEPLVVRELGGGRHLAFREDGRGRITHMFAGRFEAFERVPWHGTVRFHLGLLAACGLVLLSAITAWPAAALGRRPGRERTAPTGAAVARAVAGTAAACALSFVALLALIVVRLNPYDFLADVPAWLVAASALPVLAAALMPVQIVCAILAWRRRYWTAAGRARYTLTTVAALVFLWSLWSWNLVGWQY